MSILANNINEEIREILKEHNNNIDKKIEEQNQKNKDLKESINKSHEEIMRNANNLFRKYDKTYEILMEYVAKKIDEQDKKNIDFAEKIKIILEDNYNSKIKKKNNSKNLKENIKKENVKIKDISNDFLIVSLSLIGIIATVLIAIFFI